MKHIFTLTFLLIFLSGCAYFSPYRPYYKKIQTAYETGKIGVVDYENLMKQCKEADEQWLQEKRDNFATAMSYVSVPANQLNPNLQPQSQQPQIVNYPSYTIRQTGYNTYKAEPDGFTVLPAPAGTSSYRQ